MFHKYRIAIFVILSLLLVAYFISQNNNTEEKKPLPIEMKSTFSVQEKISILDPHPLMQKQTRIAFLARNSLQSEEMSVYFSTLEGYEYEKTVSALVEVSLSTGEVIRSYPISRSVELRSLCYDHINNLFWLGGSLYPQLFVFREDNFTLQRVVDSSVYSKYSWHHAIACTDDGTVWGSSSMPKEPKIQEWLMRYNYFSRELRYHPLPPLETAAYGGVATVDPSGYIWFYRDPPIQHFWFDPVSKTILPRVIDTYRDYIPINWFEWKEYRGDRFIIQIERKNELGKEIKWLVIDTHTHRVQKEISLPDIISKLEPIFSGRSKYFDDQSQYFIDRESKSIYLVNRRTGTIHQITDSIPELPGVEWLGFVNKNQLIGWYNHIKQIVYVDTSNPNLSITTKSVIHENRTPANITTLASDDEDNLYGGGFLTLDMFRFDLKTNKTINLGWTIPGSGGQIDNLIFLEGRVYFIAYVKAIIGMYNPKEPWNPGTEVTSNPRNFGPLGHHNQYRSSGQAVDLTNKIVYFTTYSDYSDKKVRALVKISTATDNIQVFDTIDHQLPNIGISVDQIDVDNKGTIVAIINEINNETLAWLDPTNMSVLKSVKVPEKGNHIVTLQDGNVLVSSGQQVWLWESHTQGLRSLHFLKSPIVRMIKNTQGQVALLCQNHIYRLNYSNTQMYLVSDNLKLWEWNLHPALMKGNGDIVWGRGSELLILRKDN